MTIKQTCISNPDLLNRNVLHEELFTSELAARQRAIERSKLTNKFVYLIQQPTDWMVNTHGVIRVGQKVIATFKLGEKTL